MTCCAACARRNPDDKPLLSPDDPRKLAADLAVIGQAYERLGHWWAVAGLTHAAGYPAGAELGARIAGVVGAPLDLSDLETGALSPRLAQTAREAWTRIAAAGRRTIQVASRNKGLVALTVAGVVAWHAIDADNAAELEAIERDGARLEAMFNSLPASERARVVEAWGAAHFGREAVAGGLPTWLFVAGGVVGVAVLWRAVRG